MSEAFVARLREIGGRAYHDKHPFHLAMNAGALSREAIRGWVANRFYYQQNIPRKDAAILANCPLREVRRAWIHRIVDHDGSAADEGGIEAWLRLGEACELTRAELLDNNHVVAGVRFAVDAYVNFARDEPWPVAIASSLTELFAPDLMAIRLGAFEKHYTWIDRSGLDYFRRRLTQASRDSDEALAITLAHCHTPEMQEAAVRALRFKCDVLWSMLDAIRQRYSVGHERPQLASKVRLQNDRVSGEAVLLFPEGILQLNETAQAVAQRCDGKRTVDEIVTELAAEYESQPEIIRGDVSACIDDFARRRLLVMQ